jgi:type VI protein secretion system component VasF
VSRHEAKEAAMTRHPLHRASWVPLIAAWPPLLVLEAAAEWGQNSQQQARRNALVASSRLLQRRKERLEVEEFLVDHAARQVAAAPLGEAAGGPV